MQFFFNPGPSVTIDEELITFYGRCKFRLFIPTKPDRYGVEANCFAAEPYVGKVENEPKENNGPEVVKRLVAST